MLMIYKEDIVEVEVPFGKMECLAYGCAAKSAQGKFDVVQARTLRLCTGAFWCHCWKQGRLR